MSKSNQDPEPVETSKSSRTASSKSYFFPNGGDIPAFSCQAESLDEAEKLNEEHVRQQKENK